MLLDHLLNCHGEWVYLAQLVGALPFIGYWLKSRIAARTVRQHEDH